MLPNLSTQSIMQHYIWILCSVFSLNNQQKSIKQRMASSRGTLVTRLDELKKESGTGVWLCVSVSVFLEYNCNILRLLTSHESRSQSCACVHACVCACVCVDTQEQQCRQLMAGLDKVISDLDKQEKAIYTRVRPPLEQTRPLQDSADRLQDMKVSDKDYCFCVSCIVFMACQSPKMYIFLYL